MGNVLILAAASPPNLPRSAFELLTAARELRDRLGGEVQALLLGSEMAHAGQALIEHGADRVLVTEHRSLSPHETDLMLVALETAVKAVSPTAILFPHDRVGQELGPRLAYRLRAGIVTDCTGLEVEDGRIRWIRPVYGGKAMAVMSIEGPVQIVTLRPKAFAPSAADTSRAGEIQRLEVALPPAGPVELVEVVRGEVEEGPSIDEAPIVVSGGRGIGGPEGFQKLEELARLLGGAVGASRPAVDSGWMSHARLIGQTGKIISPDLYIAIAISGAPQHMTGVSSAKTIVAINRDEDAPIFKMAHVGVVGDWRQVVPALIRALESGD